MGSRVEGKDARGSKVAMPRTLSDSKRARAQVPLANTDSDSPEPLQQLLQILRCGGYGECPAWARTLIFWATDDEGQYVTQKK